MQWHKQGVSIHSAPRSVVVTTPRLREWVYVAGYFTNNRARFCRPSTSLPHSDRSVQTPMISLSSPLPPPFLPSSVIKSTQREQKLNSLQSFIAEWPTDLGVTTTWSEAVKVTSVGKVDNLTSLPIWPCEASSARQCPSNNVVQCLLYIVATMESSDNSL